MTSRNKAAARPRKPAEAGAAPGLHDAAHPVNHARAALRLLTGKWKAEITWNLREGKLRFGELMRAIPGITQHMLTTQLRDLERHGLITRTVYAEVPPRVEYELTPAAHDLRPVFEEIHRWAERHAGTLRLGVGDDGSGGADGSGGGGTP